jgi:hypothetical protein
MSSSLLSQRRASRSVRRIITAAGIAVLVIGLMLAFGGCGKSSLVGKWYSSGTGEELEFTSDGKMIVTSDAQDMIYELDYKVEGSDVVVSVDGQDVATSAYTLDGDVMTLVDPDTGQPETYARVK